MARIPVSSIYTSMRPPLNPCWEKVLHLAQRRGYPRGSRLTLNTERENYFYFWPEGASPSSRTWKTAKRAPSARWKRAP